MNRMTEKQKLYIQESLCITIAVSVGITIYLVFRLKNAYWIPMTTAVMFVGASQGQGVIVRKSMDRVVGTLAGALLGFLYINIFMYSNYHWAYLFPLIWFVGFYIHLITSNYALLVFMFTLFVSLLLPLISINSIGIGDVLFERVAFTGLGAFIALVAEYVIYRKASSAAPAMKLNTKIYFEKQGEIISLSSDFFLDIQEEIEKIGDNYRKHAWGLISSISSMENLYLSIKYEFDYKKDQDLFYQFLFVHIAKLMHITRKLMGLVGHDKYDGTISNLEELKEVSKMLSLKYKNLIQYFNGRTDDCTERIKNILNALKPENKLSPTYFYVEVLYDFSKLADEFSETVFNKNMV